MAARSAGNGRVGASAGAGRTALITGASSGIGLDLASLFAADHWNVVLVARSEAKLREIAAGLARQNGIEARALCADLSDPGAPQSITDRLSEHGVRVDALVNNAGFGLSGPFVATDLDKELEMIQVNVVALTELTKLLLPGMVARRSGRILNLASTAAFQPGPLMAVYYATKAYVLSFSEAIADELRDSGVTVTALCPGPTETGFSSRAGSEQSRLFKGPTMDARRVAEIGYAALMAGKPVVIPGLRNRILAFSVRLAPRRVVTQIARRMQES